MSKAIGQECDTLLFSRRVGEPWGVMIRQGKRLKDPEKLNQVKNLLSSKLGATEIINRLSQDYKKDRRDILRAKILIFTGHHWVRHGEDPGSFHPMRRNRRPIKKQGISLKKAMKIRIEGIPLELRSYKVRLVIISGCYTLIPRSAKSFNNWFPNAHILGFRKSSTLYKGDFWLNFLKTIQLTHRKICLSDDEMEENITIIVKYWKKFIAAVSKEMRPTNLWKLGKGNPTSREPGIIYPNGKIELWVRNNKTGEGQWIYK